MRVSPPPATPGSNAPGQPAPTRPAGLCVLALLHIKNVQKKQNFMVPVPYIFTKEEETYFRTWEMQIYMHTHICSMYYLHVWIENSRSIILFMHYFIYLYHSQIKSNFLCLATLRHLTPPFTPSSHINKYPRSVPSHLQHGSAQPLNHVLYSLCCCYIRNQNSD